MAALDFEPRRRPCLLSMAGPGRLLVFVALACAVLGLVWLVHPERLGPASRPVPALPPPLRPIPASLPALSPEADAILATVRDGEPVRDLPYYFLLERARLAQGNASQPAPLDVLAEDLMAHPAVFRGRLVRTAGVFLREYPVELPENLAGIRRVITGEIGSSGGTIATFVLPQEELTGGRAGEDVRVTGYFLQIRRFVNRGGGSQDGPLLILTSLTRTATREALSMGWVVGFAAAGALAVGGIAAVTIARQQRRRARRQESLRHRE